MRGAARTGLLVVLVILAMDFGLAQIGKRILPQWHALLPASNPRTPSALFHHGLRPMMEVKSRAGGTIYPFNTNSLAMVDAAARRVDPRGGGCRVLVIGDSFTEGFGVGWDKSFAGILAGRWKGRGVDLLNAGVVSYSPTIYERKVRHLIEDVNLRFDALVVFIDMSDAHDDWLSYDLDQAGNVVAIGRVSQIPPMRDPSWGDRAWYAVQDNSLLAHAAKDVVGKLTRKPPPAPQASVQVPHRPPVPPPLGAVAVPPPIATPPQQPPEFDGMVNISNARWTMDAAQWDAYGRDGALVGAERMDRLLLLLRRRGIALAVAVYPWPDQIYADDRDSAQRKFWGEWARSRGVAFIDLFPPFFQDADRLTTIRRYYLRGDFHWNPQGHALVADAVDRIYDPRRHCR